MPKRKSRVNRPKDVNEWAHQIGSKSTLDSNQEDAARNLDPSQVSRVMAEMGRRGGKIGGKRRLETLSPERRREIALLAAKARWVTDKI
jgi:hypothetical protein